MLAVFAQQESDNNEIIDKAARIDISLAFITRSLVGVVAAISFGRRD